MTAGTNIKQKMAIIIAPIAPNAAVKKHTGRNGKIFQPRVHPFPIKLKKPLINFMFPTIKVESQPNSINTTKIVSIKLLEM